MVTHYKKAEKSGGEIETLCGVQKYKFDIWYTTTKSEVSCLRCLKSLSKSKGVN